MRLVFYIPVIIAIRWQPVVDSDTNFHINFPPKIIHGNKHCKYVLLINLFTDIFVGVGGAGYHVIISGITSNLVQNTKVSELG